MQFILRSLFKSGSSDNHDMIHENILSVRQSGLEFHTNEYYLIWDYIDRFSREHAHAPDIITIKNQFEKVDNNLDVLNQLEVLRVIKPVYKGDFKKRLEIKVEEQRIRKLEEILKEGNEINYNGLEVRENKSKRILKGPSDAIKYVVSKTSELDRPISGIKRNGDVVTEGDVKDFKEDYDRRRDDPEYGKGYACGLEQIDVAFGGAKKAQMWTHAAFTGHLKSTFGMNWVYYQSVYKGENSLYFSFEMPYDQCKRIIYAMHSMHEKFAKVRLEMGLQSDPDVHTGLNYKKVRDGKLDPNEEKFMKEYVLRDISDNADKYGKIMIRSYDTSKMTYTIADIKNEAENSYRNMPFSFMVVDHALLVDSVNRHPNTTERCNEVVRDLKKLAEIFNNGDGMAVLTLFQISREGVKRADKSNGIYSLYDLSYSNEIERSSDIVTASYLSENLRNSSRALFQCLKSRDDAGFQPFYSRIEWPCRRLLTCYDVYEQGRSNGAEVIPGNNLESLF